MNIGINKALGKIIKELRRSKKSSQESLAEATGLHTNTIYLLESGLHEPRLSTFLFIAKAFEIAPDKLMGLVMAEYYKENGN